MFDVLGMHSLILNYVGCFRNAFPNLLNFFGIYEK